MDCDDVMLLLAQAPRTLTPEEEGRLDSHLDDCDVCSELVAPITSRLRDLPVIDPLVFEDTQAIATGGMGRISRAFDRRLGREVAIKEVLSIRHRLRFEREAAITARLQHPAIVPIYEAGTWPDGSVFYTMRLVSGGTLADALAEATTLEARLALLPHVTAVADAIAYAHSRRIVHRDLKPQNILVGEFGETVVIDWGLAKEIGETEPTSSGSTSSAQLTQVGTIIGTPCFMSPEQANGDEPDERSDVFAVGALLYNLLAGVAPYWDRSQKTDELVEAVRVRPPTPLAELAPRAPADLRAIVERAMSREPADRYADASELAEELRRFQAGQLVLSREYRVRDLLVRWVRKHRAVVTVGSIAALVMAVVAVVAIVKVTRADAVANTAFERGQRKLCEGEAPRLASPWDANARATVHRRFETFKLAYVPQTLEHLDAVLDQWSAELALARDTACMTGRPSDQLAAQLACLADRTRDVGALVALFEDADPPTVLGAVAAAGSITPVSHCATLPPVPHAIESSAVGENLSKTHALMQLGKFKAALAPATQANAEADALGDPSLRSRAKVSFGGAQARSGDLPHGEETVRSALRLAEVAHDDRSAAQAWTNLLQIAYWRAHYDQVLGMEEPALGAAERIDDLGLQSEMLLHIGGALEQLGKLSEAQKRFEQAIAMRRKIYGAADQRTGSALGGLGNAYAMQGDLVDGIRAHKEALDIVRTGLGANHPNVAIAHGNLGNDYMYALREPEAIEELTEELRIFTLVDQPEHRDIAMTLTDLGMAELESGDMTTAAVTFDRANAMWKKVNATHPSRAEAVLGLYLAGKGSVEDLKAAMPLAAGLPPFEKARLQFALGKATNSVDLVKAAATGFATATLPLCVRDEKAATAWLQGR